MPFASDDQQFLKGEVQGAAIVAPRPQKFPQLGRTLVQYIFELRNDSRRAAHAFDPRRERQFLAELLARHNHKAVAFEKIDPDSRRRRKTVTGIAQFLEGIVSGGRLFEAGIGNWPGS